MFLGCNIFPCSFFLEKKLQKFRILSFETCRLLFPTKCGTFFGKKYESNIYNKILYLRKRNDLKDFFKGSLLDIF